MLLLLLYYLPIFVLLRDMMNQNTETINYVLLLLHELSKRQTCSEEVQFFALPIQSNKTKVWRLLCLILIGSGLKNQKFLCIIISRIYNVEKSLKHFAKIQN